MIQTTVLIFFALFATSARAASCCGGGLSLPGMIVGDDQRQFSVTTSATQLREESLITGEWSEYPSPRTSQALQLSFAQLLSDRWQAGGLLHVMHNNQDFSGRSQNSFDWGDASFFLGYEVLPEWNYSVWRPRGHTYLQIVAPTGQSTSAAIRRGGAVTGRGFWTIGPGITFSKLVRSWDLAFTAELHRSLPRTEFQIHRNPDWGGSATTGLGYSSGKYRVFSSLSLNYEGPTSSDTAPGSMQRFVTATAGGNYTINEELRIAIAYTDQTLFGEPINAPLNKTIALSISKHWPR